MWNILFLLVTLPVHMYNHYNVMYSILQRVFDGLPLQNPHLDTVWLRLPPPGDSKALLLSNHPPAGKTQISRGMLLLNKMKYFPVPKQKIIDAGIMLRPTSTYRSQGVSDDFESALQYAISWRFGECISKEMASSQCSMDHIHEIVQYVRCSIVPLCLRK